MNESCGFLTGGGIGELVRHPGALAGQLHAAFLPLIATFQRASEAAGALESLAAAIREGAKFPPGSLEEHLQTLLSKQVWIRCLAFSLLLGGTR